METLEKIQNRALRTIYTVKRTDRVTTKSLRTRANISTIQSKLEGLSSKYLKKAIDNSNKLIIELINTYKQETERSIQTTQGKTKRPKSLLCHYFEH